MPISIKCSSLEGGEVLRITAIEFYKKIMAYNKPADQIKKYVKEKIEKYLCSSAMRFQSIADFN